MSDNPGRFLRPQAVLTRTSTYESQNLTFPSNVKIGTRCIGWRGSAVAEWLENPIFYSADDPLAG